jgi:hypothetical protein
MKKLHVFGAVLMISAGLNSWAAEEDRLQVGLYAPEEVLSGSKFDPTILSSRMNAGDLQVRLKQAAPCGDYIPVDPIWEQAGRTVILRYSWHKMNPKAPDATRLCVKSIQAWVFRVPNAEYTVLVSDAVPRYSMAAGKVVFSVDHEGGAK